MVTPSCDFKAGPTLATMKACVSLFGTDPNYPDYFPPASQGTELVETAAATQIWRGYKRAIWTLDNVPAYVLTEARQYILGSATAYSGECYVRTLTPAGVYRNYRAIARFPDTRQLQRVAHIYQNVTIDLVLLEQV